MEEVTARRSRRGSNALRVIASAGAVCGVLDGLSAVGVLSLFGIGPARVFQGIARGLLGPSALDGGPFSVAVGIASHFTVALAAAAVYYVSSRFLPAMNEHAVLAGVLFGAAVHLFMNFAVIPLSAIGSRPISWPIFLSILAVHLVVVGPSISLTVRRFAEAERRQADASRSPVGDGGYTAARNRNV